MCGKRGRIRSAFEDRVVIYVLSWCFDAKDKDLDRFVDHVRECCTAAQCDKFAHVCRAVAAKLSFG